MTLPAPLVRLRDSWRRLPQVARVAIVVVAVGLVPIVYPDEYLADVLTVAGIYAVLSLGLNVVIGYAGLLVLGYAAFYAIGAYTYGLLASEQFGLHVSFWLCLPLAAVTAGLFGLLLGLPVLRLRGDYLAIVTLGFGEIVRITFNNLDRVKIGDKVLNITNGPNGILGVDHPRILQMNFGVSSRPYFYLVLVLAVLSYFALERLKRSRVGRAWVAIREDELAAGAMGIPVVRYKMLAFVIGAAFAGLMGAVYAGKAGHIAPDSFLFLVSITVVSMVVLGGLGSVPGAVLGAAILYILPETMRFFATYRMLFFGLAIIFVMIFRSEGILGRPTAGEFLRNPRRGSPEPEGAGRE